MKKEMKQVWIGLAEVAAHRGSKTLGSDKKGASVNVIAFAKTPADFRKQLSVALKNLELHLVGLEDVEPFAKRVAEFQVAQNLVELASKVEKDKNLRFGTFHTFPLDRK